MVELLNRSNRKSKSVYAATIKLKQNPVGNRKLVPIKADRKLLYLSQKSRSERRERVDKGKS